MLNVLNSLERLALAALRDNPWIAVDGISTSGFSRAALENLRQLGLAKLTTPPKQEHRVCYTITDDGWRCMYGFAKAQIDSYPDSAPVPFRIWQWPLAEASRSHKGRHAA